MQCLMNAKVGGEGRWWCGLIREGMQAERGRKIGRGVHTFTIYHCSHTGVWRCKDGASDKGQDSPCIKPARGQQDDKCSSHMKTEWISRLGVFNRRPACGPAGLHYSGPIGQGPLHNNLSLG